MQKMIITRKGVEGSVINPIYFFIIGFCIGFGYTSFFYVTSLRKEREFSADYNLKELVHKAMDTNVSVVNKLLAEVRTMESKRLFNEVKILCWICTSPLTQKSKAVHVKATWGRHCNKLLIISETDDPDVPTVKVDAPSGRIGLWAKTVNAFKHIHDQYLNEYDWFLKADDDSYIVVENLRKLLLPYDTEDPGYFGFQFKTIAPKGYMSGGGGYVLSREALRRLATDAFSGKYAECPPVTAQGSEDADMGRCLHTVGVYPGDSRDAEGHYRFFPFDIESYVHPDLTDKSWWYWDFIYWPHKGGDDCCTNFPISYHYVTTEKLYMLEYLIYHLNVFSVRDLEMAETPIKNTTTAEPITEPAEVTTIVQETKKSTAATLPPKVDTISESQPQPTAVSTQSTEKATEQIKNKATTQKQK